MQVFHSKEALRLALTELRQQHQTIGLVPTMGALHQGHLSLVQQALEENDTVIVSIFVNPTQFDKAEDLENYPRSLQTDVDMLHELDPNVLVFSPDADNLYDGEVEATSYAFGELESVMEGQFRSGHFDGVGTVLNLLFRTVEADRAYFGEKDYQQLLVVRKLVEIEQLPVQVVGCPIYREPNGLAMSSRNRRLSADQREEAGAIHRILTKTAAQFEHSSLESLRTAAEDAFSKVDGLELEYFEIARADDLSRAEEKEVNTAYRAFVAAYSGPVRLIDNMALN